MMVRRVLLGVLVSAGAVAAFVAPTGASTLQAQVLGSYPKACLKAVTRPAGSGLIASVLNGKVTIGMPADGKRTLLPASFPSYAKYFHLVLWSPDGRYLATGDGRLWTTSGHSAGRLFRSLPVPSFWSWSPTGDCVLASTSQIEARVTILSVAEPGRLAHQLLRAPGLQSYVFAPDGRSLYFTVRASALARVALMRLDLATGKLAELRQLPAGVCCVDLGGWAPGGRVLLYWAGAGGSVMADGAGLSAIDTSTRRPVVYGTKRSPVGTIPDRTFLLGCARRLFGVVGGGRPRPTVADKRLAALAPGKALRLLTPAALAYLSPVCSPRGSAIAAVQFHNGGSSQGRSRLALLSLSGAFRRYLTPGGAFTDGDPEWARSGIVVARTPLGGAGGPAHLWFGPDATTAHDTGLRATDWDWSATRPSGFNY